MNILNVRCQGLCASHFTVYFYIDIFSVGIFVLKSRAGLSYLIRTEAKLHNWLATITTFVTGYGLLFLTVWYVTEKSKFLDHLDGLMVLLKNGVTTHFLLAGLLLV